MSHEYLAIMTDLSGVHFPQDAYFHAIDLSIKHRIHGGSTYCMVVLHYSYYSFIFCRLAGKRTHISLRGELSTSSDSDQILEDILYKQS